MSDLYTAIFKTFCQKEIDLITETYNLSDDWEFVDYEYRISYFKDYVTIVTMKYECLKTRELFLEGFIVIKDRAFSLDDYKKLSKDSIYKKIINTTSFHSLHILERKMRKRAIK